MPPSTADSLYEREPELSRCAEVVVEAGGGSGRLLVIEGPPGVGKTMLLEEVCAVAERNGVLALRARGGDLERDFAFGVVRQLFELRLRHADADERASLLQGPARFAAPMLLGEEQPSGGDGSDPYTVLHGLYWLTSNLAEHGPVALCVDDAHWSDPPSLRFLNHLARRVADLPVLIAITLRTADPEAEEELPRRLRSEPGAEVLRPGPLSAETVSRMVRGRLGEDAVREFCDACHAATGGNPFLLGELISSLAADGVEPSATEAPGVAKLVPDAIGHHVLARLGRLPPDALRLARAAAVLGGGEALEPAAELAGLDAARAQAAAETLVEAELLRSPGSLEFAHPMLREAIYADLPAAERAAAHRRAAALLAAAGAPGDRIAAQLLAGPAVGEPWALEALRAAAREALGRGAPETAASLLRRALAETPAGDGAGGLLLELAGAELTAGSAGRAIDHLERVPEADPEGGMATVAPLLHVARWRIGRFEAAVEIADRAAPRLAAVDPGSALLLELSAAITVLEKEGIEAAAPRYEAIRGREGDPAEPPRQLAGALVALAALENSERPVRLAEAAATGVDAFAPPLGLQPFAWLIVALHALERYETALRLIEGAIERARARGDASTLLVGLTWRAWNALYRGDLDASRADAELAHTVAEDAEYHMLDVTASMFLGWIAAEVEPDGELARWNEGPFEPQGDASDYGKHSTRGALRLAQGRYTEARDHLVEAAAGYDQIGLPVLAAGDVLGHLARAHFALGEAEEAEEVAGECLRRAERAGTPRVLGIALRCVGLIGSPKARLERLADAVAALEQSPAQLELAHALCDLGAALRRDGRREDAREPLRRARALAHARGASLLERRAHEELLSSGGRPRRIRTSGQDSLTPSERRVAAMAADGLSNREIAQNLFVSLKTVEMHLSRSYRKLDIRSRSELPGALEAAPDEQSPA